MKNFSLSLSAVLIFSFVNCNSGYRSPYGFFLQQTSFNKEIPNQTTLGSKIGEGCIVSYGLLISQGDASLKSAAHNAPNGGITKIYAVDYRREQFMGFLQQKLCTIVYGD